MKILEQSHHAPGKRWTTLVVRELLRAMQRLTKMEDAFMADTVIAKGLCIFQLLPAIDETQWIVGPIIAAAVLVIDTLANASTT
jgi:hypothetical protein